MRIYRQAVALFSLVFPVFLLCASAQAGPVYVGVSAGADISPDVSIASRSNDRASTCDECFSVMFTMRYALP